MAAGTILRLLVKNCYSAAVKQWRTAYALTYFESFAGVATSWRSGKPAQLLGADRPTLL